MLAREKRQRNSENNGGVCPESSIESANQRNFLRAKVAPSSRCIRENQVAGKNCNKFACESTVESSPRRDFIKRAALLTAAGAAGALGAQNFTSKLVPRSEAANGCPLLIGTGNTGSSTTQLTSCIPHAAGLFVVNCGNSGCGSVGIEGAAGPLCGCFIGLTQTVGVIGLSGSLGGIGVQALAPKGGNALQAVATKLPGESGPTVGVAVEAVSIGNSLTAIFRNQPGCSPCTTTALIQMQNGDSTPVSWNAGVAGRCGGSLGIADGDFYIQQAGPVCHGARFLINPSGNVGIGTITPNSRISLGGFIGDSLFLYDGVNNKYGFGIRPDELRIFHGTDLPCDHTSFGNYNGTTFTEFMRLTNQGHLGIGTTTPSSSLCVTGSINASGSVSGASCSGDGVRGLSKSGPGVAGFSSSGPGLFGAVSGGPLTGKFKNFATSGDRTALAQFETGDTTAVDWNIGVAGACNPCSIADGQFFIGQPGKAKLVVNASGQVGIGTITPTTALDVNGTIFGSNIGVGTTAPATPLQVVGTASASKIVVGTTSPQTTLQVKGGVSYAIATKKTNYTMTTSDFAILGNASSKAITITLPSAKNAGMVVHIKKIDGSIHAVTVSGAGTDTIEGAATKALTAQYQSLTLLAGGKGVWYIQASAT